MSNVTNTTFLNTGGIKWTPVQPFAVQLPGQWPTGRTHLEPNIRSLVGKPSDAERGVVSVWDRAAIRRLGLSADFLVHRCLRPCPHPKQCLPWLLKPTSSACKVDIHLNTSCFGYRRREETCLQHSLTLLSLHLQCSLHPCYCCQCLIQTHSGPCWLGMHLHHHCLLL